VTIGTDGNAYVAWADWRVTAPDGNPSRQGFLSVIPLAAFSTWAATLDGLLHLTAYDEYLNRQVAAW